MHLLFNILNIPICTYRFLMLGSFFRESTDRKQRIGEKQNLEFDSPVLRGGQGKYYVSFPWPPLKAALSIFRRDNSDKIYFVGACISFYFNIAKFCHQLHVCQFCVKAVIFLRFCLVYLLIT